MLYVKLYFILYYPFEAGKQFASEKDQLTTYAGLYDEPKAVQYVVPWQ